LEELLDQRERKILVDEEHLAVDRNLEDEEGAAGEVDHDARQRLVERHVRMAEAADAALVAEGFGEGLTEDEGGVLDRVVIVDVRRQLARRGYAETSRTRMPRAKSASKISLLLRSARNVTKFAFVGKRVMRGIVRIALTTRSRSLTMRATLASRRARFSSAMVA